MVLQPPFYEYPREEEEDDHRLTNDDEEVLLFVESGSEEDNEAISDMDETASLMAAAKPPPVDVRNGVGMEDGSEPGATSDENQKSSARRKMLGVTVCVFSAVFDSMSMASVQVLDKSVPDGQLNVFRYSAQLFLLSPCFLFRKPTCNVKIDRSFVKWLVILAVLSNGINYGRFAATYYLPLGTCSAFGQGCGMVFSWLTSLMIFREPKLTMLPGMLFSIAGVVLVLQPQVMFGVDPGQRHTTSHAGLGGGGAARRNCFVACNVTGGQNQRHQNLAALYKICQDGGAGCSNSNITSQEVMATMHGPLNGSDVDPWAVAQAITPRLQEHGSSGFGSGSADILSDTAKGYIMLVTYAVCMTISNYIINKACSSLPPMKLNFWMPLLALPVAMLNMVSLEEPSIPGCWTCILAMLAHSFLTGGQSMMRYMGLQIIHPVLGAIIMSSTTTFLNFILQYSLLNTLHPGHRNWIEYLGATFTIAGLILAPLLYVLCATWDRRTERKT